MPAPISLPWASSSTRWSPARRRLAGRSQASLIAAILERDPPAMSTLQPMTPRLLDRVVKKCLAKNPDHRWQAAGDLLDELKWVAEDGGLGEGPKDVRPGRPRRITSIWAITSTVLLAGALLAAGIVYLKPVTRPDQIRFEVATPQMPNPRSITISPDGRCDCFRRNHAFGCNRTLRSPHRIDRAGTARGNRGSRGPVLVSGQPLRSRSLPAGGSRRFRSRVVPRKTSATRRMLSWRNLERRGDHHFFSRRHSAARIRRRRRTRTHQYPRRITAGNVSPGFRTFSRTVATTFTWPGHLSRRTVRSTSGTLDSEGRRQALRRTIQGGICRRGVSAVPPRGNALRPAVRRRTRLAFTGEPVPHIRSRSPMTC